MIASALAADGLWSGGGGGGEVAGRVNRTVHKQRVCVDRRDSYRALAEGPVILTQNLVLTSQ